MKRFVAIALFLLANSFAAHVAVLETTRDDENLLDYKECQFLTDKLRQMAIMELPSTSGYTIMTRENINTMLPPGKSVEECEGSCLVETGKNISADYVAQGRVSHFGSMVTLTVELYETASGKLVSSFAVQSENAVGLLKEIEERAAPLFKAIKDVEKPKPLPTQETQTITAEAEQQQSQVEESVASEDNAENEAAAEQPVKSYKLMHAFNVVLPIENATWDDESIEYSWGFAFNWSYYQFSSSSFSSLFALTGGYAYAETRKHGYEEYGGFGVNVKYGAGYAPVRSKLLLAFYGFLGIDFKYLYLDYYEGNYHYDYYDYYDGYSHYVEEDPEGDLMTLNLILGSRILLAYQLNDRSGLNLGVDVFTDAIGFVSYVDGGDYCLGFEEITVAPYIGVTVRF